MSNHSTLSQDIEIEVLEHIQASKVEVRQRDIAHIISKSLGMTNAILRRLSEKGMLAVAKVNNRNISYVVTPAGLREIAKRSYRYVKRTIRNVVFFKEAIDLHIDQYCSGLNGLAGGVVLVGRSDVDFIVEHLSHKRGLTYAAVVDLAALENWAAGPHLLFLSEDLDLTDFETHYRSADCCRGASIIAIASLIEASNHD